MGVKGDGKRHFYLSIDGMPEEVVFEPLNEFVAGSGGKRKQAGAPGDVSTTMQMCIRDRDYKLPGMLVAMVAYPPRFGGVPRKVDSSKAKAVRDVVEVVEFRDLPHGRAGVAVLAKNTWAARQGRDALVIEWDESQAFTLGSEEIFAPVSYTHLDVYKRQAGFQLFTPALALAAKRSACASDETAYGAESSRCV